ncbi:MAG: dihydroxyacetone kinase family protein [Bifidobacteriaceae bacterium]|jgi:dihydroxyacetone kinase|nr:dihydroxyacetone kinase family protein [Bifidobacteriaceae bacterium]
MTYLVNDPTAFTEELTDGFTAVYPDRVRAVPGGVVRAAQVPVGQVAVVIGGGSGHYPAFAGLVGPGLAHGAAMGNVFASPSAQQIYSVAKAAQVGAGVLLSYGNYAGDVLNFDAAQERLRAEGIDCRTVVVTDDISSARADEASRRRGIAGDLCIFKAAAYAAEKGWPLERVWEFANHANQLTRSFGIAFTGCTLPGATAPLFTVPAGRMGIGIGIHGEPGLREDDRGSAHEVARLLVDGLLADRPENAGTRVAVLTNGLGSVKYEELFVLHRSVDRFLREAGLTIVQPDVGELCTSFEMAGVSLTLFWLADGLEAAWLAPADAPGYRKGAVWPQAAGTGPGTVIASSRPTVSTPANATSPPAASPASRESRATGRVIARAIDAAAGAIEAVADHLGELDAVAGDGDHGIGMRRGVNAARQAAATASGDGAGAGSVLIAAADAWSDRAGGTSGALWGLILRTLGTELGDETAPDPTRLAAAVHAATLAVQRFGKARVGDKTLVDALAPFASALARSATTCQTIAQAWSAAAPEATRAASATADLMPKIGRARPHASKSLGTPDPGAVSMATVVAAVATSLAGERSRNDE